MNVCLFLSFKSGAPPPSAEAARLDELVRATPQLVKALIHAPASTSDPYVKDGPSAALLLQLYFAELTALEAAVSRDGHLRAATSHELFPILARAEASQQAMLVRPFPVPDPVFRTPPREPRCTYLVSYEGEAEDLNAWHAHYLDRHTRHMAMFPGIRELEIYTRLDWVSLQPWTRSNFMQRNKVVFDSASALSDALNSPVRHDMRADFKTFPRFSGPNNHYAMATRVVKPR
ncbi:MAG: hypothetical protein ACRECV_11775 [Xanthobacteraceae bacterium]